MNLYLNPLSDRLKSPAPDPHTSSCEQGGFYCIGQSWESLDTHAVAQEIRPLIQKCSLSRKAFHGRNPFLERRYLKSAISSGYRRGCSWIYVLSFSLTIGVAGNMDTLDCWYLLPFLLQCAAEPLRQHLLSSTRLHR